MIDEIAMDEDEMVNERSLVVSPVQKCALLLVSLGVENASAVLKHLSDKEVEKISIEMARLKDIPAKALSDVIEEFYGMQLAKQYMAQGGLNFARELLEKSVGLRKAENIVRKVEAATEVSAFHLLQTVDDKQLLNFLQNEHPQTASLILANLKPAQAANILSELPEESQYEIAYRLATMEKTSPELIEDIESVLRDQLGSVFGGELSKTGGAEAVANILNSISRTAEKNILSNLKERDEELTEEITNYMFLFDDIINLPDEAVQRIVRDCDSKVLALALKASSSQLQTKFFKGMSERASSMLKDELEFLGPVKLKDVESAQKQILEVIHNLEASGAITLNRGEEEEIIE